MDNFKAISCAKEN